MEQRFQKIDRLQKLFFWQHTDDVPSIRRDKSGDLILPAFQFTDQVNSNLISLRDGQCLTYLQQALPSIFTHRQMFAYGEQIGQMHGRVECRIRMPTNIIAQQVDLYQLYGPVNRVLQVA